MNDICVVIKCLKEKNGVIAQSIKNANIPVFDFTMYEQFKNYKYIIYFYNKIPPYFEVKGKTAWWMCDFRKPSELGQEKPKVDFIFICHKTYDKLYRSEYNTPIYYLPQVGLSELSQSGRSVDWDMLFLGTVNEKKVWHRGREQLISFLSANLKFKHISGEKDTIDQSYLYNRTKYNLAISYPMVCGTSNRLYNILASGGFCMAKQFPEIELLFEKGKHLQWFQEKEEILDMVDFYNKNPLKHEKVKLNGLKLYLEKHTAEKRMQNALDIMQGKTTQFYGYL